MIQLLYYYGPPRRFNSATVCAKNGSVFSTSDERIKSSMSARDHSVVFAGEELGQLLDNVIEEVASFADTARGKKNLLKLL